jgi:hypothetical protein
VTFFLWRFDVDDQEHVSRVWRDGSVYASEDLLIEIPREERHQSHDKIASVCP